MVDDAIKTDVAGKQEKCHACGHTMYRTETVYLVTSGDGIARTYCCVMCAEKGD